MNLEAIAKAAAEIDARLNEPITLTFAGVEYTGAWLRLVTLVCAPDVFDAFRVALEALPPGLALRIEKHPWLAKGTFVPLDGHNNPIPLRRREAPKAT